MIFTPPRRSKGPARIVAAMAVPVLGMFLLVSCSSHDPYAVPVTRMGVKAFGDTTTIAVRTGDTLYVLAQRLGVDMRAMIDANHLSPPYMLRPGQRLRVPAPTMVTVQKGDTLFSIARAYDADQSEIVRLNGMKYPFRLTQGQNLRLPSVPVARARIVSANVGTASAARNVPVLVDNPVYETGQISTAAPDMTATDIRLPDLPPLSASAQSPASAPVAGTSQADTKVAARPPAKSAATGGSKRSVPASAAAPRFSWPVNGSVLSDFGPKSGGRHNDGINIGAPAGTPVRAASAGEVVYSGDKVAGFGNLILVRHAGGYATAYAHVQNPLVSQGENIVAGQTIASVGKTGNVSTPQLHFEIRKGTKAVDPNKYLP